MFQPSFFSTVTEKKFVLLSNCLKVYPEGGGVVAYADVTKYIFGGKNVTRIYRGI